MKIEPFWVTVTDKKQFNVVSDFMESNGVSTSKLQNNIRWIHIYFNKFGELGSHRSIPTYTGEMTYEEFIGKYLRNDIIDEILK